jgi:hypothetical protein
MKTIKDLEEITGYSREPIRKKIKELMPNRIMNSYKTELSEEESLIIIKALSERIERKSTEIGFRWLLLGETVVLQKRNNKKWETIPFVKNTIEENKCPLCGGKGL